MNITLLSPVVYEIKGRIGNTVYMYKVKGVHRARSVYKDIRASKSQREWRTKYSLCDSVWKGLSESVKDEWKRITYWPGQTRYSTFMKVNLKRLARGRPIINNPPY